MNTIKVGPNEIAYKESGNGETIVFLHGFCGSMSYWDKIMPQLTEQYRVILIDLRGHGHSSYNDHPFTIDDMAKDIKEVLESLHLGQVYLFGHSLGGYITLSLVEHFPEKIKGYGLIHSTALPDTEEGKKSRINAVQSIETDGIRPFIEGLVPKLFSDESLKTLNDEVEKAKQIGYSTNPKAAQQTLLAMKGRPERNSVLKKSTIPVLLVAGDNDKVIPVENTFSVEGGHIKTGIIQNAGHMSMVEKSQELSNIIKKFMEIDKK